MPTTHRKGRLEVIVGCMSSGKSEAFIGRIKRVRYEKRKAVVFKPSRDVRTDEKTVASRDGRTHDAVSVASSSDILAKHLSLVESSDVIGIDEAQFFDTDQELIAVVNTLIETGKRVIVAGLDTDFRGEPFEIVGRLMAIADSVSKLKAVCTECGRNAVRSQRLIDGKPAPYDAPRIQVGGDEQYQPRCRNCHSVPSS